MYSIIIIVLTSIFLSFVIFFIVLSNLPKIEKIKKNKVKFYVTRNKYKTLCLYLRKPIRCKNQGVFIPQRGGCSISYNNFLKDFGLNIDDYKNLTWDDEPVEVFLDLED